MDSEQMDLENNIDSVFQKGCLVHLTCSIWGGRVRLPSGSIKVDAAPEFVNATKYLVDRDCLKPIEKIRNEARSYIYSKTLPFPIPGLLFVPRDMVPVIDRKMEELKTKFMFEASNFAAKYNTFIEQAKEKLNGLFNILDYPRDIWKCFSFHCDYINMNAPNKTQIISREILEREQAKFEQTMADFRETATNTLRATFAEMVDHIVERLSGERKVFKNTLIGNIKEFINDFKALNINDDAELADMVEKCNSILSGVDVDTIRDNDKFRQNIANSISTVQTELNKMMIDRPVRKLRKVG